MRKKDPVFGWHARIGITDRCGKRLRGVVDVLDRHPPPGNMGTVLAFLLVKREISANSQRNMATMHSAAVRVAITGSGTIIGGFCDSLTCLMPWLKSSIGGL